MMSHTSIGICTVYMKLPSATVRYFVGYTCTNIMFPDPNNS
uniref:Uncharacterized protein n=1 Tax=Anguilla anguilla TaxID=7936 RepID=A0A0E9T757_ANGAN